MKTDIYKLFKKEELLDHALTHRSWLNENHSSNGSNERLEFLGDAILEYVVSSNLFANFPDKEEGYLTALRANLVNTQNLARVATKLEVGKQLKLSKGEEDGGGRSNSSLLADTLEAIIGALYLDQGMGAVRKFIEDNILRDVEEKIKLPLKDTKSRFQEIVQAKGLSTPKYVVKSESGPDHDKKFIMEVHVNGKVVASGTGKSKAEAAQNAAEHALAVKL
jgi:ribonuclease-3